MSRPMHLFGQALKNFQDKNDNTSFSLLRVIDNQPPSNYFGKITELENSVLKFAFGNILDIGIGTGRIAIELQKKFQITGIDSSFDACKIAKKQGIKKVCVCCTDLTQLSFAKNSFDSILLICNGFGLAGKKTKNFLQELDRISKPEAKIITTIRYPDFKMGWASGINKLRLGYNGQLGDEFEILILSPKKLELFLKNTNWEILKIIKQPKQKMYGAVLTRKSH